MLSNSVQEPRVGNPFLSNSVQLAYCPQYPCHILVQFSPRAAQRLVHSCPMLSNSVQELCVGNPFLSNSVQLAQCPQYPCHILVQFSPRATHRFMHSCPMLSNSVQEPRVGNPFLSNSVQLAQRPRLLLACLEFIIFDSRCLMPRPSIFRSYQVNLRTFGIRSPLVSLLDLYCISIGYLWDLC